MYTYYKKTLVVFSFALARRYLEMVFRPALNVLNVIIHKLFFLTLEFLHIILYTNYYFFTYCFQLLDSPSLLVLRFILFIH